MPEVKIGPCIRCGHDAHIMDGLDFGDGLINVYQNCHNTECKLYMVNKRVGCKCKEINHRQVSNDGERP